MGHVGSYLLARFAEAALALVVLVTLTFFLVHAMPGGPGYAILGLKSQPTALGAVNLQLGVDTPLLTQYAAWWRHLAQGRLGTSYVLNRPVAEVLLGYAGRTLPLQAAGLGLGLVLSFAGGLAHGAFHGRLLGRLLGSLELLLYATPGFVIGTFLVLATEGWLPPGGIADLHQAAPSVVNLLAHLLLPATCIGLMTYSVLARYLAQSIHAELGSAYARTAAAKGLAPLPILLRHITRNALRPVVTLSGLSLPGLFAGSVVVESVFAYPGIGWLLWRSALAHDYPVLVGGVLLIGIATIIGNFAADALNIALDPRLRAS